MKAFLRAMGALCFGGALVFGFAGGSMVIGAIALAVGVVCFVLA